MGREFQGLRTLGEREAVTDKSLQIHLAVHDKTNRLFLQIHGGAVGPHQSFLIDTDGCRIDHGLSVLRLRKKQYPSSRTGPIHRGTNQRVAADRKNYCIGAASLGELTDTFHHVCP